MLISKYGCCSLSQPSVFFDLYYKKQVGALKLVRVDIELNIVNSCTQLAICYVKRKKVEKKRELTTMNLDLFELKFPFDM